jgi:cytochrome P450
MRRNVATDIEYKGVKLRGGDKVGMWYVSANRDEDVFTDPFRFDITRDPSPFVAFGGGGAHYCLGANLAHGGPAVLHRVDLAGTPSRSTRSRELSAVQLPRRYQAHARAVGSPLLKLSPQRDQFAAFMMTGLAEDKTSGQGASDRHSPTDFVRSG